MEEILVDRTAQGIVTVTLDRPHVKNAIVPPMWEELRRIFQVTRTESARSRTRSRRASARPSPRRPPRRR